MEQRQTSNPAPAESKAHARVTTIDGLKTHHAITINRSAGKIYAFWRDFQNLPNFLKDVQDIRVLSDLRSHWTVRLKSGFLAEWDAVITSDEPGRRLAWQSEAGSDVETFGEIRFDPANPYEGAVVSLSMSYHVPGGKLTELVTFFSGEDPATLAITNLKRLKATMETGEFPTTEGQPSGRDEVVPSDLKH